MPARVNFTQVFERSPNPYMLLDRELRYVAANAAYLAATRRSLDQLLGKCLFDVFPNDPSDLANDSAERLRESLRKVIRTGEPDVLPLIPYSVAPHGDEVEVRYWSATHTPLLDAAGAVEFVLQHTVDVTDVARHGASRAADEAGVLHRANRIQEENRSLQRLESELAAQLERERFLAESIPQQVWTATPDGRLESVNRRVTEYFGMEAEAVLGVGWQALLHPDDVEACLARWRQSLASGEDYEVEFRLRRRDGAYRWHLGRASAFHDARGRIVKWFGTNTDVDEVKRARDELQARSELDRQLIGIVSHDLRNPLNAIGMGVSLLNSGPLDDPQRRIVQRMLSSFERASRLIRDFLDFTQARVSGQFPIARAGANIRQIAHQICDEVQSLYPGRTCVVEHTGREEGNWDPDRLAQLVGNLVSNAFQHSTPDGEVRVRSEGRADGMVVSVHNEGEPIPEQDLARLFQPFERGSEATTSTSRNVGLGLYICQQIVAAHGGTMSVESSRDAGTTFTFRLPY